MNIKSILTGILVVAALAVVYVAYTDRYGDSGSGTTLASIDDVTIALTVADTPEERIQGLSGQPSLGKADGKLFIFDEKDFHGIWMKNMNFPIDIIWLDDDLTIIDITADVSPDTFPRTFEPPRPVRFVLEVNAHFADSFNIAAGDVLRVDQAILPAELRQ